MIFLILISGFVFFPLIVDIILLLVSLDRLSAKCFHRSYLTYKDPSTNFFVDEILVEWTLVRRHGMIKELFKDFLRKNGSSDMNLIGEQFTDENGRVDLIYETNDSKIILVELETSLSGKDKFAFTQTIRYKNMGVHWPGQKILNVVLYAKDVTPQKLQDRFDKDCKAEGIQIVKYDLKDVQEAYENEVQLLSENIGLVVEEKGIASVANYSVASANKFLLAFKITGKDALTNEQIRNVIPSNKGPRRGQPWAPNTVSTNLVVPEGFGFIKRERVGGKEKFRITEVGKLFLSKYPFKSNQLTKKYLTNRQSEFSLTLDQKRIALMQILKDEFGKMSRAKAMILYFLKLVSIDPNLIPALHGKSKSWKMDSGDVKLCQRIFGTNWAAGPAATNVKNVMDWAKIYALELGLVEEIMMKGDKKRTVLTSLGSRVHSLLELTQALKKEVIHIPQQLQKEMSLDELVKE